MTSIRRRASTRVALALFACLASGLSGCAGPTPSVVPAAPAPIDLAPRCLAMPDAPRNGPAPDPAAAKGAGSVVAWAGGEAPRGARGFTVSTPDAPLESIAWGFGPTDPRDAFALELAAALLREGSTTATPADFRARVRALGGGAEVHVEDGWLWLELQYEPAKRAAAIDVLADWVDTRPADSDVFAATRRSVALARLAAAASATDVAARAFGRLHPTPEGAVERGDAPDVRRDWDSASLDAFLRAVLQPDGSVLLHSSTGARDSDGRPFGGAEVEPLRRAFADGADARQDATPAGETSARGDRTRRPPLTPEPGAIYLVDRPGSPQVEILVGLPTVGPAHEDAPALEMLASLLGGNVGGRLFRDLRERQGLAYIIDAAVAPEGRFVVTTRARADRVPALLVGIEAHLRALASEPLLDCEVAELARRMAGEEALLADDPTALRARLRAEIERRGRLLSSAERAALYTRVGKETLESVARRDLAGPPIVVLVGDEDVLRRQLSVGLSDRRVLAFDGDLEDAR